VALSQEELVDAERQRQLQEKMRGCPFFAGVSRENAPKALKEHVAEIKRKSSQHVASVLLNLNQNEEESKDIIAKAMSAFSAASAASGDESGRFASTSPVCPVSGK